MTGAVRHRNPDEPAFPLNLCRIEIATKSSASLRDPRHAGSTVVMCSS
jgi:hypothetical protein